MAKCRLIHKKITKRTKRKIWDAEKFKNEETKQKFKNRVHNEVIAVGTDFHEKKWLTILGNMLVN